MKTDRVLRNDVVNELEWEPSVVETHIGVTVEDGIVSLHGHVTSYAERNGAEEAVKRVSGVTALVNDLQVKLPTSNTLTDEDVAAECIHALHANSKVPKDRIKVIVRNHWVTLEGEVEWHHQAVAVYNSICGMRGVGGITNLIKVKTCLSPSDVNQKILDALARRPCTGIEDVKIEVDKNTVILRGKVSSWANKSEVERAAWSAPGISHVQNDLEIDIPNCDDVDIFHCSSETES